MSSCVRSVNINPITTSVGEYVSLSAEQNREVVLCYQSISNSCQGLVEHICTVGYSCSLCRRLRLRDPIIMLENVTATPWNISTVS